MFTAMVHVIKGSAHAPSTVKATEIKVQPKPTDVKPTVVATKVLAEQVTDDQTPVFFLTLQKTQTPATTVPTVTNGRVGILGISQPIRSAHAEQATNAQTPVAVLTVQQTQTAAATVPTVTKKPRAARAVHQICAGVTRGAHGISHAVKHSVETATSAASAARKVTVDTAKSVVRRSREFVGAHQRALKIAAVAVPTIMVVGSALATGAYFYPEAVTAAQNAVGLAAIKLGGTVTYAATAAAAVVGPAVIAAGSAVSHAATTAGTAVSNAVGICSGALAPIGDKVMTAGRSTFDYLAQLASNAIG